MTEKPVTIPQMAEEIGQRPRTIRTWMSERKIPFIRMGHRTVLLYPSKVKAALTKFEVPAATSKSAKGRQIT
jgi:excisionase family DNA binding protein